MVLQLLNSDLYFTADVQWTKNNCELRRPLQVDTTEGKTARKERERNPFLVLYDVKQVQALVVAQRRTAVSSKCFQLYYTCSDTLRHLFSILTVTFPKLAVILRSL
jgi:hypothetical protein